MTRAEAAGLAADPHILARSGATFNADGGQRIGIARELLRCEMNHANDISPVRTISPTSRLALLFLAVLVGIGAWLALIAWREHRLTRAVLALPPDVQEATYRRSFEELATTCTTEPQLAEHCSDEARFILRFPQCTSECRQMAWHYFPTVRK